MAADYNIFDVTGSLECDKISWQEFSDAAVKSLARRVEMLAVTVAHSCSARTEQGRPHTIYCNGVLAEEGLAHRAYITPDFTTEAQIATAQQCIDDTYEAILANKPPNCDVLVWRIQPELNRLLCRDGLHVKVYTRLSWVPLVEGAN